MKIIGNLKRKKIPEKGICAVGNFDGVHLGHCFIFRKLVEEARNLKVPAIVLTFYPHPLKVLYPEKDVKLIYTREQKNKIISNFGIDFLYEIPFDWNFSKISAREFIENFLVRELKVKGIVVGSNFAFGNKKEGNPLLLKKEGKKYGFFVEIIKPLKKNNLAISSTNIRKLLMEGKVEMANQMLGRFYSISGKVVEGKKRGKKIGVPTINLELYNDLILKEGIYSGFTIIKNDKKKYLSAISIGKNPTFGDKNIVVETHLIDFSKDIYGNEAEIFIFNKIRDQKKFKSVDELVENINKDIEKIKSLKDRIFGGWK